MGVLAPVPAPPAAAGTTVPSGKAGCRDTSTVPEGAAAAGAAATEWQRDSRMGLHAFASSTRLRAESSVKAPEPMVSKTDAAVSLKDEMGLQVYSACWSFSNLQKTQRKRWEQSSTAEWASWVSERDEPAERAQNRVKSFRTHSGTRRSWSIWEVAPNDIPFANADAFFQPASFVMRNVQSSMVST